MNLCLGKIDNSIAIDIFDRQELNVDHSGAGNRNKFERNLHYYGNKSKAIILHSSSLDLTVDDIKKLSSELRFVSIDGGHWYRAVINDLTLASSCAGPECIIAIDDLFNPDFPEVAAAVLHSWRVSNSDFVPLCVSRGKLYLYRGNAVDQFYAAMNNNKYLKFQRKKTTEFLGREVPFYTGPFAGLCGFIGQYTSFYTPHFHTYIKTHVTPIRWLQGQTLAALRWKSGRPSADALGNSHPRWFAWTVSSPSSEAANSSHRIDSRNFCAEVNGLDSIAGAAEGPPEGSR